MMNYSLIVSVCIIATLASIGSSTSQTLSTKSGGSSSYTWQKCAKVIPPGAVIGGYQVNYFLYVARILDCKGYTQLPAKTDNITIKAYAGANGKEINSQNFEILISSRVEWQPIGCNMTIPTNAIVAGKTANGEPLYVGRRSYKGNNLIIGWVTEKLVLTVSYFTVQQYYISDIFEILVEPLPPTPTTTTCKD